MVTRRISVALAVSAVLLMMVGCGSNQPSVSPTATPNSTVAADPTRSATQVPPAGIRRTHSLALPVEVNATSGPVIRASASTIALQGWRSDDEVDQHPVAAHGDKFLVNRSYSKRPQEHPTEFVLWDPATGRSDSLWSVPAGKQHAFIDGDRGWVAVVEAGYSLPLPRWSLMVRNLDSGEMRQIGASDERVLSLSRGVQLGPAGYAPLPTLLDGRVAWVEVFVGGDGRVGKRLQLYDIAKGKTATIAQLDDATLGDLESPSLGGNKLAWLTRGAEREAEIVVRDLATNEEDIFPVGGDPYSSALSSDGAFLAWDDTQYAQKGVRAKYAVNLTTDEVTRYAEGLGWGTDAGGHFVSWTPWENKLGFYDMENGIVRYVDLGGAGSVYATVLGRWYTWQESRNTGEGIQGSEAKYYFLRLDD